MATAKAKRGFTLVELMIVVAMIGILASIAIPGFLRYQMNSRRSEAFTNLAALAQSQKGYFAEWSTYVWSAAEPQTSTGVVAGPQKRDETPVANAFALVGWTPEGDVYYDYDTCSPAGPATCTCTCATCFTSTAYGDLDGDNSASMLMYVQPDASGGTCGSGFFNKPPPVDGGGNPLYSVIARHATTDLY